MKSITPGTHAIDATHSNVEFAVKHMMISTVKGRFGDVSGTVNVPASGEPTVDVTIKAASIDTRVEARDNHLRSADFFDVEKYPVITFKSTRVTDVKSDTFKLVGDLTMHGVTREVTLDVTAEGRGKDPWGGERAGYSAVTRINRKDFGLTWNQVLETGGIAVGDEIKISLDLELVKA